MNHEYHVVCDFKELIVSKYKITRCDQTWKYEVKYGVYEYHGKKKTASVA